LRYFELQGGLISFMFKGAIAIFAFSIFLFGCAPKVTVQLPSVPPPVPPKPVLLPDLTISDISLNGAGKVEVMISNIGKGPAPHPVGSLVIYVDGHLRWKDSLVTLPDQTFLQPGVFVRYTTPVELTGQHEVRAVVDLEEMIVEENEENNAFTKTLGKEVVEAKTLFPDLTITDLFLNPRKKLAVTIANIGDSPLPLGAGNLKILVDGALKGSYTLRSLSDQAFLQPKGNLTFITPMTLVGRHEIDARIDFPQGLKESNEENNTLKKFLNGLPIGPDIVVKDIDLTEDLDLMIFLSNAGIVDLRKGVIFQIRIRVNERKVLEFDHFIVEALKASFGNYYLIDPPHRVGITGISKVKVSISPKLASDDIRLENNVLERTFIIFPFKIGSHGREEFSFSFSALRPQGEDQTEKVRIEARWEGGSSSLMLSFKKLGTLKGTPTLSGKSPLKVDFPIPFEEVQKENVWSVLLTNLVDKKMEGHLIIQHP
jgi:archaellum component FlaG (FlaF/FlaG flagellin family)